MAELTPYNLQPYNLGRSEPQTSEPVLDADLQAWKDQKDAGTPISGPFLTPIEAGFQASQGMFWSALKAGAQMAGQEVPDFIQGRIDENMNLAASADIDGLWDKLQFAVGQLGPAAGTMLASTVLAPLVGSTATFGATMGGILSGLGLTAGDQQQKAEDLDPDHVATIGQGLYSLLLTAPDAFMIGRAKTILSPMKELIDETVKGNLKTASSGRIGRIASDSIKIGGAEALQDVGTGVGANYFTGTEIDESRIRALSDSALDEAIIGTLLGVPLSGANLATAELAQAQIDFDANRRMELEAAQEAGTLEEGNLRNKKGDISEEVQSYQPAKDAVNNLGFFSYAYNTLTGSATGKLKAKLSDNQTAQRLLREFNLTAKERLKGGFTLGEKAQAAYANFERAGSDFFNATEGDQLSAWERRAEGKPALDNPVDIALRNVLTVEIPKSAWVASRGELDLKDGLWLREDYLPIQDALDWNKVVNDPQAIPRAIEMLEAAGRKAEIKKVEAILEQKNNDFRKYGNNMHMGADRKRATYENKLVNRIEKAVSEGKDVSVKRLMKGFQNEYKKNQRESSMTLERALKDLPQEWFTPYYNTSRSPAETLRIHMKKSAEAAAHIDSFGVNLEKFDEMVARAVVEGQKSGAPLTDKDVTEFYDILRTSQRIHLNPRTKRWRDNQQKIRAAVTTVTLGLSALVSIPEALVIGLQTDMRSALAGVLSTMKIRDKGRALVASEDLGMSLNTATNLAVNRVTDESYDVGNYESAFIKYGTGLPFLQHFLSVWGAKSQDHYLRRQLNALNSGKLSLEQANHIYRKLAEAGINVEKATDWAGRHYPMDDPFFSQVWVPKLHQLTRDTIVDPTPIDKPLWMNDERFMLLAQLKGFMTVFTNRVMAGTAQKLQMEGPGGNRELVLRVAPYVAAYLVGQIAMGGAREFIKSGEIDSEKEMTERLWQAFGYLGSTAYGVDFVNALRYRSDPLASFAGPSVSIGTEVARAFTDPERTVETIAKRLYPNSPFKGLVLEAFGVE
jgi:hypothetical protein